MESESLKFVMDEDVSLTVFSFLMFIQYFPYVAKLKVNDQYIHILWLLESEGRFLKKNKITKISSTEVNITTSF